MAWTTPTRYPNSMEIADNEAFLNTNVIDNLVDHESRIVSSEAAIANSQAAWTAYTPTLTNTTAGIAVARYRKIGKTVDFYVVLVLTGAQVTGLPGIALPPFAMLYTTSGNFDVQLLDGSVVYAGVGVAGTTARVDCYALNTAGTYAVVTAPTSSIPFTWAATDQIIVSGTYEAA